MASRKMPQNLEAEMSVLGVSFLNKNALSKICEELNSDMFYSDANKKLFEAIKYLLLMLYYYTNISTIK